MSLFTSLYEIPSESSIMTFNEEIRDDTQNHKINILHENWLPVTFCGLLMVQRPDSESFETCIGPNGAIKRIKFLHHKQIP